jgi:hypothetical protein
MAPPPHEFACDPWGNCRPVSDVLCTPPDICTGKPCGAPCIVCPPDLPDCPPPAMPPPLCGLDGQCHFGLVMCGP